MPSSNQSAPPPVAGAKTGNAAAVEVKYAFGIAAALVALGFTALVADIIGFWLVLMWLCFLAAIVVAIYAAAVWYGRSRRRLAVRRAGPFENLNGAGDGMCS